LSILVFFGRVISNSSDANADAGIKNFAGGKTQLIKGTKSFPIGFSHSQSG
jgi:hypothetical protein